MYKKTSLVFIVIFLISCNQHEQWTRYDKQDFLKEA